jgi:hypothetical protein
MRAAADRAMPSRAANLSSASIAFADSRTGTSLLAAFGFDGRPGPRFFGADFSIPILRFAMDIGILIFAPEATAQASRASVITTHPALTRTLEWISMARADSPNTTSPSVADAYAHLIQRLQQNRPHHLPAWHLADALDFEDRAEHLRRLLVDVETYTRAVMVDMARSSNIHVDTAVTGGISDLRGDVVGTLLNAAEELRGFYGRAA